MMALSIPSHDARPRTAEPRAAIFSEGLVYEEMETPGKLARQMEPDTPVLEGGVNLPGARVYHLSGDDGFSVTMVVNESLDI
jgi:hypothetical protein